MHDGEMQADLAGDDVEDGKPGDEEET